MTLYSGRQWMMERYERFFAENGEHCHFVALLSTRDVRFGVDLASLLRPYDHTLVYLSLDPLREPNKHQLARRMAHLYNEAKRYVPPVGEWVWVVEDDVEPPREALPGLLSVGRDRGDAGVLAASIRNRKHDRLIAWDSTDPVVHITEVPEHPRPVAATGLGCTLFHRAVWEAVSFHPGPAHAPYYDWALGADVAALGYQWLLSPLRCRHWQEDGAV